MWDVRTYERKSYLYWQKKWERALSDKICPIAGCALETRTCEHLDNFLAYDPSVAKFSPKIFSTNEIDEFALAEERPDGTGAWSLFKRLRRYPLANDQIGILIRKFVLTQSLRQIQADMGWTTHVSVYRRYREAIAVLKKHSFSLEDFIE